MVIGASKRHLQASGKAYFPHGWFAAKAGVLLIFAGLTSLVHAVLPCAFPFLSRDITRHLADLSRQQEPPERS